MPTTVPDNYKDLLQGKNFAHVATIGPHGEPQSNPVWFNWDGTYIRFSQTKTRQKYRNLQRNPHIALSVIDPTNPYRYIEVRGKVVRIDDDPNNAFINSMAKKYLNQDVYPWHRPGDERVVITVQPEAVTKQ